MNAFFYDTLYPKIIYLLSGVIVVSPSKRFVIDQFVGFGVNKTDCTGNIRNQ